MREEESRISTRESRVREPRSREAAAETAAAFTEATAAALPKDGTHSAEAARPTAQASQPADRTVVVGREPPVSAAPDEGAAHPPPSRPAADAPASATRAAPGREQVPAVPSRKPSASPRRLLAAALLGLIVLGAAGFGLGRAGRDDTGETARAVLVGSASNADVTLDLPARWRRAERSAAIPGLDLTGAMTLVAGPGADSGLVVGRTEGSGPGLLPVSLARRAVPAPGRGAAVRTAQLQGYRHENLRVRGYAGRLDVLATPTSRGTLAFVCFAPGLGATVRGECERVVASARLVSGKPGAVGPDPGYARRLNTALAKLNREVRPRRLALAGARTPQGQSRAAAGLGRVYEQGARSVRRASPPVLARAENVAIARLLARTGATYGLLSSAARTGSRRRYESARRSVSRSERDARAALDGLERLGYARPRGN